jgi:hypothetical protein
MHIGGIGYRGRRRPIDGSIGFGAHVADTYIRHLLDEDDGSHSESTPTTLTAHAGTDVAGKNSKWRTARLKKLLAETELDRGMLKELAEG